MLVRFVLIVFQQQEIHNFYANHSVLSSGKWAKIRVPANGIYNLTTDVIRRAGFSDLSKVRIYGYGGNLQDERISSAYLKEFDDLKEVSKLFCGWKTVFFMDVDQ